MVLKLTDKPGSVSDNHSSRRIIADKLKQLPRSNANSIVGTVLPYSGRSLPATNCYQLCGALLPHRFTLT